MSRQSISRRLKLTIFLVSWISVSLAELPESPDFTIEYKDLLKNSNEKSWNKSSKIISKPRVIQVGEGKEFSSPSEAEKSAVDGDTIEIYAGGVYLGDEVVWKQNNIKIKGVGGRPHIKGKGLIANGKALWVITGNNVVIENIEFSNAKVKDQNGAAIRNSGKHLKIVNCYIHHNENGILTGSGKDTIIEIQGSEFSYNGFGGGRTHNIYVGNIAKFLLVNSYIHHAYIGHNVKSRAKKNIILYNKIIDGKGGQSSYAIDISNGGETYIIGNIIQQGKRTENSTLVSYAAEGFKYLNKTLYLVNNTLVNDRYFGMFVKGSEGSNIFLINNIFYGKGKSCKGLCNSRANYKVTHKNIFVDVDKYNYRPKKIAAIIDKGVNSGIVGGIDLTPAYQYVHPAKIEKRIIKNKIDIGAYEYK